MTLYLTVAKFEAYGTDKNRLNLIHNYLTNRKQRTKIRSSHSDWFDIVKCVLQGSILGPLFFNLFINDHLLFMEITSICNFADDNTTYNIYNTYNNTTYNIQHTTYSCNINLQTILRDQKYDILKWFKVNSMKPNPKKYQLMILGKGTRQSIILNINNIKIRKTSSFTRPHN